MAYGDIISDPLKSNDESREKNGVETVNRAVVIKDASTKGSGAIDFLFGNDKLNINKNGFFSGQNRAGVYVGTQGDLCVLLSGQSAPVVTGTATSTVTNKLADASKTFVSKFANDGIYVATRDLVVNTTDNTVASVASVANGGDITLVDIANVPANIMASGESYEIYRAVLFQNIAAGSFLPIQVDRVFDFGTTADDIILIY
tara:strand:+ start:922 stop:1527 length:606 start_codon:yes stop_codon:yes gene_type:complete